MSLGRFILQNTELQEQFCNCLFTQEWFPFFFQNCVMSHFYAAPDCSWSHFPVLLSLRDQSLYSQTWAQCLAYNRHSTHFLFWINKYVSLSICPRFFSLRKFIARSIQFQLDWSWQKFFTNYQASSPYPVFIMRSKLNNVHNEGRQKESVEWRDVNTPYLRTVWCWLLYTTCSSLKKVIMSIEQAPHNLFSLPFCCFLWWLR